MQKFELNSDVSESTHRPAEAAETSYRLPELHEIGRSRDLIQGASCCGPYDGRGYYPQ